MLRRLLLSVALLAFASVALADNITIEVQYPYGVLFNETYKIIGEEFQKDHPNIKVKFRSPYESYEKNAKYRNGPGHD